MLLGFVQLYYPLGMYEPVERKKVPKKFYQNMMIVGSLRWVLQVRCANHSCISTK